MKLLPSLVVAAALVLSAATFSEPTLHQQNVERLRSSGFRVSPSLPASAAVRLRPSAEIVHRLLALHALALWVAAPASRWSDEQVRDYVQRWELRKWLTAEEREILRLSRSQARTQHLDSIGWQLENAWSLAWVLGYPLKPAVVGQLQGDQLRHLVFEFLPGPSARSQREFLDGARTRGLQEVLETEDYFRCAHNAVRSAQSGGSTVPQGYHPQAEGGAVQERRHGLTWCVSPGVSWEDTDLST